MKIGRNGFYGFFVSSFFASRSESKAKKFHLFRVGNNIKYQRKCCKKRKKKNLRVSNNFYPKLLSVEQ